MTYKGKEITEEEITVDIVKEIVINYCYPPDRPKLIVEKKEFPPDKMYDYQAILDVFLRYLHNPKRKMEIEDIEACVLSKCKGRLDIYHTDEYIAFMRDERAKRRARMAAITLEMEVEKRGGVPLTPKTQSYDEQIKDPRWYSFRNFVFVVRGCKCEKCGKIEHLQIHHPNYISGRKAWEYTCNEVVVLCRQCHREEHGLPTRRKKQA